jgi:16S rRNA (cytosine967-C5)-methyltransferase
VHAVAHEGRSADAALEEARERVDRAAVRAIALGTMRWYLRLRPAVAPLVSRPFDELSPKLAALLVTAAHQIEYSRGAPEAQVHLAVDASRVVGESRASGVVNAVLRKFVAQRAALLAAADADLAQKHAHPAWLVEELRAAWGESAESILAANNLHPPMTLRLNTPQVHAEDFLRSWRALGREARPLSWNDSAVVLERAVAVQTLPGFDSGAVSVQDAGAQLAAPLLDAVPGMRVLDACAAPGGKTLHIAQRTPGLAELIAADDDPLRLARPPSTGCWSMPHARPPA